MKLTALEFVQRALSAIDAENVETIDDSVEAEQVKVILDSEYERLINRFPWTCKATLGVLNISPDPMRMTLPTDCQQVEWIKYNKKDVKIYPHKEFYDLLLTRDTSKDNVDGTGCYMDRDPKYCTIYDGSVWFDSYNISLVSTYSRVYYYKSPPKLVDDLSIPLIPDILHTALLDAVTERAFRELKGDENQANMHYQKYIRSIIQAQRWADVYFPENSTYSEEANYARKT